MSSPPVNIPHKADSGGGRRSALTSAFEELALFADQKTDEVRVRAREPVGILAAQARDAPPSRRQSHAFCVRTRVARLFPRAFFFSVTLPGGKIRLAPKPPDARVFDV